MTETTTQTETQSLRYRFTLLDNGTKGKWEIHRSNCPDIRRKQANRNHFPVKSTKGAESAAKAVRNHWLDEETRSLGYDESDVVIMDCAHTAHGETI